MVFWGCSNFQMMDMKRDPTKCVPRQPNSEAWRIIIRTFHGRTRPSADDPFTFSPETIKSNTYTNTISPARVSHRLMLLRHKATEAFYYLLLSAGRSMQTSCHVLYNQQKRCKWNTSQCWWGPAEVQSKASGWRKRGFWSTGIFLISTRQTHWNAVLRLADWVKHLNRCS